MSEKVLRNQNRVGSDSQEESRTENKMEKIVREESSASNVYHFYDTEFPLQSSYKLGVNFNLLWVCHLTKQEVPFLTFDLVQRNTSGEQEEHFVRTLGPFLSTVFSFPFSSF